MADRDSRWRSSDLAAVLGLTALTWVAVFVPFLRETPLRPVLGLLFTLFVPGYAFVAALFPNRSGGGEPIDESANRTETGRLGDHDLDTLERSVFSFGVSIVLTSILVIIIHYSLWEIDSLSVLTGLSAITVSATGVAGIRRSGHAGSSVEFSWGYLENVGAEVFRERNHANRLIAGILVVGLLFGTGGVMYLVTVHESGSFTEFYILTENESESFVATDDSAETFRGDDSSLALHISNHEGEKINYTVIAAAQRVRVKNSSVHVMNQQEIERFRPSLASGENWSTSLEAPPSMSGDTFRLVYLLYRDQPPHRPTTDNAYQELHLWINGLGTQKTLRVNRSESMEAF